MKRTLSLLLISLGVRALAGDNTLELRPQAQVTGAGVFLDDIASSTNAFVPHLRVATAPRPGQTLTLARPQIEPALVRAGFDVTNCLGAARVSVSRRVRLLEEDELRSLLATQLQGDFIKERGELELRLARPWAAVNVPDEPLKLRVIEMPVSGVSALFVCRLEVSTTNETVGAWQVSLQAKVWREVWVSRTALHRGSALADAELVRERRDALTLREAPADFVAVDPGMEAAEYIAPNAPLYMRSLKLKPAVRRGQSAEAMVVDGALAISMKVEVLEDGVPGQSIRIRNPQTKRELRGKVQNEQTIIVSL